MSKPSSKSVFSSQGGFSLVELAIVMTIMGLLFLPLLQQYKVYQVKEKVDNTTVAFNYLTSALNDFYINNGRYPCPSDGGIAFGSPGHGVEKCTEVLALGPQSCTAGNGLCRLTGNPPTAPDVQSFVHMGGIPYVTLDIPYVQMLDGYRNPMGYVVSEWYDNPQFKGGKDATTGAKVKRSGAITYEAVLTDPAGVKSTKTTKDVFYALVSHGIDGNGSFNLQGQRIPCGLTSDDTENCDLDFTVRQKDLTLGSNASEYFDDRVMPVAFKTATIWAYSDETDGAIYNTNPGAIGIGTTVPDDTVKLDVEGDIKSQQMRSTVYCDKDGNNCFKTETIAGPVGAQCSGAGMVLVGIADNKPVCAKRITNIVNKACPAGQAVTGIDASGNLSCTPIN